MHSDARLVTHHPYRSSPDVQAEINRQVDKPLDQKIVEPCDDGIWYSPVLLASKRDSSKKVRAGF